MKLSFGDMAQLVELLDTFADKRNAKIEGLEYSLEILVSEIAIKFKIREMTDEEILQRDGR